MKKLITLLITTLLLTACSTKFNSATEKSADKKEAGERQWIDYTNEQFGFSMQYPKSWVFDENATSFLDLHLYNQPIDDSTAAVKCGADFIGMEIEVGLAKDEVQEFGAFVKGLAAKGGEVGTPAGKVQKVEADGLKVYQSEISGWDTPCKGAGYFVEQDKGHYIYVLTGSDRVTQGKLEPKVILETLSSIKLNK